MTVRIDFHPPPPPHPTPPPGRSEKELLENIKPFDQDLAIWRWCSRLGSHRFIFGTFGSKVSETIHNESRSCCTPWKTSPFDVRGGNARRWWCVLATCKGIIVSRGWPNRQRLPCYQYMGRRCVKLLTVHVLDRGYRSLAPNRPFAQ